MKKVIFTVFIILFLPIFVFAYSNNVILGGQSIAISLNSNGIIVTGYYKVNNMYINKNIQVSDVISKIDGVKVNNINEFLEVINDTKKDSYEIEIERRDKIINTNMIVIKNNREINTGLYVKDNIIGIGTLTYIDPISKVYGSLGHEITLDNTENKIKLKDGNIFESVITSINKSRNGYVGSKNANIDFKSNLGSVEKNTQTGVYGHYTSSFDNKTTMVADFNEIKKSEAYILTVNKNKEIKKYKINIIDKYNNKKDTPRAFSFIIDDEELLNETGGIIQGMSGSPIIQDNKLIGAVTNVLIDDVKYGYGISIITMLKEGDKLKK